MRTRPLVHAPLVPSPAQLGEILSIVSAGTGADFCGRLRPGGFLCLGEAEWPADRWPELEIVDRAARIFQTPADAGRRGGATA
jgi:hypothetical protein